MLKLSSHKLYLFIKIKPKMNYSNTFSSASGDSREQDVLTGDSRERIILALMGDVLFAPGSLSEGGIRRGSSCPTEFPVALDMLFYYELLRLLVCMVFIKGDCCGKA